MKTQKIIINKALAYIEEHLDQDMDLEEIAECAGYSKYHLNRMFSEAVGCTIYKYLQARRLTVAAEKLVHTDAPITQIALEAGYGSQQAFTLAFHQVYKDTPRRYRKRGVYQPRQDKISLHSVRSVCRSIGCRMEAA